MPFVYDAPSTGGRRCAELRRTGGQRVDNAVVLHRDEVTRLQDVGSVGVHRVLDPERGRPGSHSRHPVLLFLEHHLVMRRVLYRVRLFSDWSLQAEAPLIRIRADRVFTNFTIT